MSHRLRWPARMVIRGVDAMTWVVLGHGSMGLAEELVSTMGLARTVRLSLASRRALRRLTREVGEIDASFLAGLAALWRGCAYCSTEHVMTGALLWFREHGSLHPLHPERIDELLGRLDDDGMAELRVLLAGAPYERLRTLADRMYELDRGRAQPSSANDELLVATLRVFEWVVECTIVLGLTWRPERAAPYYHPVYRDRALRARYDQAWARAKAPAG